MFYNCRLSSLIWWYLHPNRLNHILFSSHDCCSIRFLSHLSIGVPDLCLCSLAKLCLHLLFLMLNSCLPLAVNHLMKCSSWSCSWLLTMACIPPGFCFTSSQLLENGFLFASTVIHNICFSCLLCILVLLCIDFFLISWMGFSSLEWICLDFANETLGTTNETMNYNKHLLFRPTSCCWENKGITHTWLQE